MKAVMVYNENGVQKFTENLQQVTGLLGGTSSVGLMTVSLSISCGVQHTDAGTVPTLEEWKMTVGVTSGSIY